MIVRVRVNLRIMVNVRVKVRVLCIEKIMSLLEKTGLVDKITVKVTTRDSFMKVFFVII